MSILTIYVQNLSTNGLTVPNSYKDVTNIVFIKNLGVEINEKCSFVIFFATKRLKSNEFELIAVKYTA